MMLRFLALLLVAVLLIAAAYLAFVFQYAYSSGERAGWVLKFSHKGWICKTWEGELTMQAVPGSIPEKFIFTVRDAEVAAQIDHAQNQRVRLHYEEHRGVPTNCFGDTGYWVDAQTLIAEPSLLLPGATPSPAPTLPAAPPPAPAPAPATSPAGK